MDCCKYHLWTTSTKEVGEASLADLERLGFAGTKFLCSGHVLELPIHLGSGHACIGMKVGAQCEHEALLDELLVDRFIVTRLDSLIDHLGEFE
jgi:hypothetical protein